jgi:hypothetical protein
MVEEEGLKQFNVIAEMYYDFDKLFRDVVAAFTDLEETIVSKQVIKEEWASAGKKDILDKVIEDKALRAIARECESNTQSPSSGKEADMTIKVETSIEQTIESLGSLDVASQPYGVSTTITGPVTPVVFNHGPNVDGSPAQYVAALGNVAEAVGNARHAGYMSNNTDSDEEL